MSKERRLGRGLEALLGRPQDGSTPAQAAGATPSGGPAPLTPPAPAPRAASPTAPLPEEHSAETFRVADADRLGLVQLSVHDIDSNPFQPRKEFAPAELEELCESLQTHGLLQPILVRPAEDRYQLIAGERRLRAAIKAGWSTIPAQLKETEDREMAELAIVENLQRKDLNPLEKAASFQRYLETYGAKQEELANRLNIDRSTVSNLIRLLELPTQVQQALHAGDITQGHARALLPLGDEPEQVRFCQRIKDEKLSVRQTEALVSEAIRAADAEPLATASTTSGKPAPTKRNEHVASLEQEFRAALGVKVDIRQGTKGRGRIVIHFRNHDDFDRVLDHICPPLVDKKRAG